LDLTNALIAPATEKYSKCLFTRKAGGARPQLVCTLTENAQSAYVVKQVAHLRREGTPLDRMAVLFRAGFHSFDLELELNRATIPFVKMGGFKFVESAHIKDTLAHLKIFSAPRDRLSWYRILLLIDKIGPRSAQQIYDALMKESSGPTGLLTAEIRQKNAPEIVRLKELIAAIDAAPNAISRWGELVLEYYLPILKTRYDDYPRRQRDIEQLITIMDRYQEIDGFLADMALEPPNTASDNHLTVSTHHNDSLTLTTIHSAKGLEWDTVFIIWALDGRFPSHHAVDDTDAMEEERRLMYVAATRAERHLHIVYPTQIYDRTTQSYLYEPSRFLDGIFEETLERVFYK
jgi:DNA helicase-2/ATP-dependent DNA helicase PcrA